MIYKCDRCNIEVERFKDLKKVRKEKLCKECYKQNRKNHQKETIEKAGIKDDLRELKNRYNKEKGYSRKAYEKKVGHPVRVEKTEEYIPKRYQQKKDSITQESNAPIKIKGSILRKSKSNSYLTLEESRNMLRVLMNKGLSFKEAKERKEEIINTLKETREKMKVKGISEEKIKSSKMKMLEELYKF